MSQDKYRIDSPTIALFEEDGRHVAHIVPGGSVVVVDSKEFDGNKLMWVMWAEKRVMMFTQDIRTRGIKINTY